MMTERITAAEWRASQAGKKPSNSPDAAQVQRTVSEPPKLPSEQPALNQEAKNRQSPKATEEQKRDARARPRFAVADHDFGGRRFVAHGITSEQEQHLRRAAEAAGIQEQN